MYLETSKRLTRPIDYLKPKFWPNSGILFTNLLGKMVNDFCEITGFQAKLVTENTPECDKNAVFHTIF